MKTKLHILSGLLLFAMYSCGNSFDSKYFSTLPSTLNNLLEDQLEAKAKFEELAEAKDFGSEYAEVYEKLRVADPELENQVEELSPSIIGTEIPLEVSEGLPYKVTKNPTISEIKTNGRKLGLDFIMNFTLTSTDDIELTKKSQFNTFEPIYLKFVDKQGNVIDIDIDTESITGPERPTYISQDRRIREHSISYQAGQEIDGEIRYYFKSYRNEESLETNKKLASLEKIVIISKEEYNTIKEAPSPEKE